MVLHYCLFFVVCPFLQSLPSLCCSCGFCDVPFVMSLPPLCFSCVFCGVLLRHVPTISVLFLWVLWYVPSSSPFQLCPVPVCFVVCSFVTSLPPLCCSCMFCGVLLLPALCCSCVFCGIPLPPVPSTSVLFLYVL